jgi:hypothetical protein
MPGKVSADDESLNAIARNEPPMAGRVAGTTESSKKQCSAAGAALHLRLIGIAGG